MANQKDQKAKEKHEEFVKRLHDTGLSQRQLAKFLGVGQPTVSSWITGKYVPHLNPRTMARLCVALGCSSIFELDKLFDPDAPSMLDLVRELEEIKFPKNP